MTVVLQLPFRFDPVRLAGDLEHCRQAWQPHANRRDYAGEWGGVALRSASGAEDDLLSIPGLEGYREASLLQACAYFREVLDTFACPLETVRLLRLTPGSVIAEHTDRGASYAEGFFRLHVPITTNAETRFVVAGHRLVMQPGECWYADFTRPHSVSNEGASDRVHLIIDGRRNEWSDAVFAAAGYDFAADADARRMRPEVRRRVVEELRSRGTETDRRLADALEADG